MQLIDYEGCGDCVKPASRAQLCSSSMESSGRVVFGALPVQGTPVGAVLTSGLNSMSSKADLLFLLHGPQHLTHTIQLLFIQLSTNASRLLNETWDSGRLTGWFGVRDALLQAQVFSTPPSVSQR